MSFIIQMKLIVPASSWKPAMSESDRNCSASSSLDSCFMFLSTHGLVRTRVQLFLLLRNQSKIVRRLEPTLIRHYSRSSLLSSVESHSSCSVSTWYYKLLEIVLVYLSSLLSGKSLCRTSGSFPPRNCKNAYLFTQVETKRCEAVENESKRRKGLIW